MRASLQEVARDGILHNDLAAAAHGKRQQGDYKGITALAHEVHVLARQAKPEFAVRPAARQLTDAAGNQVIVAVDYRSFGLGYPHDRLRRRRVRSYVLAGLRIRALGANGAHHAGITVNGRMKLADTVFARNGDGNDRLFFVANASGLLSATARRLALGYILLVDAATMTAHLSDFNARVHFDSSTLTDVQFAGEQEPASNGRAQCNGVLWEVCFQTKDLSLAGKARRGNGAK